MRTVSAVMYFISSASAYEPPPIDRCPSSIHHFQSMHRTAAMDNKQTVPESFFNAICTPRRSTMILEPTTPETTRVQRLLANGKYRNPAFSVELTNELAMAIIGYNVKERLTGGIPQDQENISKGIKCQWLRTKNKSDVIARPTDLRL